MSTMPRHDARHFAGLPEYGLVLALIAIGVTAVTTLLHHAVVHQYGGLIAGLGH